MHTIYTHIHAYILTHMYTHICTLTHFHMHTCIYTLHTTHIHYTHIHTHADLLLKPGRVNVSGQNPGEAGPPVQRKPHKEIQVGLLIRTRGLCSHYCGNLTHKSPFFKLAPQFNLCICHTKSLHTVLELEVYSFRSWNRRNAYTKL